MSRRRVIWALPTVLALALAVPGTASASASARDATAAGACANVFIYSGGRLYTRTYGLRASRVSCRVASRVVRAYVSLADSADESGRPLGFRCRWSSARLTCRKGSARVSWRTQA